MSIVKLNNRGVKNATAFGSGVTSLGSMVFIKKLTASSSGTLSFVNGASSVVLDSTYKEYLFTFKNIPPATDGQQFKFQTSTNTGSSYGVTITSTYFIAYHNEGDTETSLGYITGSDQAQTTNFMVLGSGDAENDSGISGTMSLFNPSSTTFVKHFISRCHSYNSNDYANDMYIAGYFNDTNDIDAVQFKMNSGNIDAGDICLYGIL